MSVLDERITLLEIMYDSVVRLCFCLTSFYVTCNPLQDEDNVRKQNRQRLYAQVMRKKMKKKTDANNSFSQR